MADRKEPDRNPGELAFGLRKKTQKNGGPRKNRRKTGPPQVLEHYIKRIASVPLSAPPDSQYCSVPQNTPQFP